MIISLANRLLNTTFLGYLLPTPTSLAGSLRADRSLYEPSVDPATQLLPHYQNNSIEANIAKIRALNRSDALSDVDIVACHPPTTSNNIQLLVDGKQAFSSLVRELNEATHSIHMSYFAFHGDKIGQQIADVLIKKAQEGVKVRLVYDAAGISFWHATPLISRLWSSDKRQQDMLHRLEDSGVEIICNQTLSPRYASPIFTPPDHKKMVIIDGQKAFTGSMNVSDHYAEEWHDYMVMLRGPAVAQMQTEFFLSWLHKGGKINDLADDQALFQYFNLTDNEQTGNSTIKLAQNIPGHHPEIKQSFLKFIQHAKKSIHIAVPYLTSKQIICALIEARKRGVEVHIILPSYNDSWTCDAAIEAWVPQLLDAGIKLYQYPKFSHTKVMLIDDRFVSLGSSNMDGLSMNCIYEMNLNIDDLAFANQIKRKIFIPDMQKSIYLKKQNRGYTTRLTRYLVSLFGEFI